MDPAEIRRRQIEERAGSRHAPVLVIVSVQRQRRLGRVTLDDHGKVVALPPSTPGVRSMIEERVIGMPRGQERYVTPSEGIEYLHAMEMQYRSGTGLLAVREDEMGSIGVWPWSDAARD